MDRSVDAVLQSSRTLRIAGKHEEAIVLLTEILHELRDARLFFSRGVHFELTDQPELAVADYTSAINLGPETAKYYYHRGCVYSHSLGSDDAAVLDFEKVIELDPSNIKAHQECCLSQLVLARAEQAIQHATAALHLAPDDALSHFCMGEALMSLRHYSEAVESFSRAVEIDPSQASHWAALGRAHSKAGTISELTAAVEAYTHAIRLSPTASYYKARGNLRLKLGFPADAIADLNAALELQPNEVTRKLINHSLGEANKLVADNS